MTPAGDKEEKCDYFGPEHEVSADCTLLGDGDFQVLVEDVCLTDGNKGDKPYGDKCGIEKGPSVLGEHSGGKNYGTKAVLLC